MTMIPREIRTAVPPTAFLSVQDFLSRRSDLLGTLEIDLHGLPLHFFLDWRDAPVTLVNFSGTASAKVQHVPALVDDGISRG